MKFKRCPDCNSCVFALYYRSGAGGKEWVKIKERYCKKCKRVKMLNKINDNLSEIIKQLKQKG